MDSQNLQIASSYINNLLLSRGLLRNGTAIEFANPPQTVEGANAIMAQIISLVHDLVLRRDRETETLSMMSQNMQSLRSVSTHHLQTISRLETHSTDLDRQLALSVAQERTAKESLRSIESRHRVLREEMARLKMTVAQIRSQCANDVRKRDHEIKRLKKHFEGRRGREGNGGQVGIVVLTPGTNTIHKPFNNGHDETNAENPLCSLKQESTEHLTKISQNLMLENEALSSLISSTLSTLRNLQGLPEASSGAINATTASLDSTQGDHNVITAQLSIDHMAADTHDVIEHLRGLLTNPSFVSLEEVEIREDEIIRLREGWEIMEARWTEAISLMDEWKKRIVETGDTINLEDLSKGLDLGSVELYKPLPNRSETLSTQEGRNDHTASPVTSSAEADALRVSPVSSTKSSSISQGRIRMDRKTRDLSIPQAFKPASGNEQWPISPWKTSIDVPNSYSSKPQEDDSQGTIDELSLVDFANLSPRKPASKLPKWQSIKQDDDGEEPILSLKQKLENASIEAEAARCQQETISAGKRKSVPPRKTKAKQNRRRSTLLPEELDDLLRVP